MSPTIAPGSQQSLPTKERCLVVISYYDQRPVEPLFNLLQSLEGYPSGGAHDVCVVVNDGQQHPVAAKELDAIPLVMHRPNIGMNIGAWDHGWRRHPGYRDYLFLQDECYAVAPSWLDAFRARSKLVGAGLVGESMNPAWNSPWEKLREERRDTALREHTLNGEPANRVDVYLDFMRRHGIDPGPSGQHLRALVWFANAEVLTQIGGFPVGANYGECIASEIAVSRRIAACGYALAQVADRPFSYFRHREWKEKFRGGPFRHFRA